MKTTFIEEATHLLYYLRTDFLPALKMWIWAR